MKYYDKLLPCSEFRVIVDELELLSRLKINWNLGGRRIKECFLAFAENQRDLRIAGEFYDEGDLFDVKKWDEDLILLSDLCSSLGLTNYLSSFEYSNKQGNYERAAAYMMQVIDKDSRSVEFYTLFSAQGQCLVDQKKNNEAKAVYTFLYNLMSETSNLDEYFTLETANKLINVLIDLEEYYDAERFARVAYELIRGGCLQRPDNNECIEIANAAQSLAEVSYHLIVQNGPDRCDIEEAEMLAKKAVRIRENTEPSIGPTSRAVKILIDILQLRNHDDEAKQILERSLAAILKIDGCAEIGIVARNNLDLAILHRKIFMKLAPGNVRTKELRIAKSYAEEAVRICTKMHLPPTDTLRLECKSELSDIMKLR